MAEVRFGNAAANVIAEALWAGLDAELRATGGVLAPTVHMFAEDLGQPYIGYVRCRRFYRGSDAAVAIGELGVLPSVLRATRVVVSWEAQDLNVALQAPVDPDGRLWSCWRRRCLARSGCCGARCDAGTGSRAKAP